MSRADLKRSVIIGAGLTVVWWFFLRPPRGNFHPLDWLALTAWTVASTVSGNVHLPSLTVLIICVWLMLSGVVYVGMALVRTITRARSQS
jgi:hypothetical protein